MVRKAGWYRPADCVGFYPPRGELTGQIGKVLKEEGRRIEMDLRAVETGGLSIGKRLVRPDMKSGEPCGRPGCVLDLDSEGAGGPHNVQCIQRCLQALWRGGGDGRVLLGRVCIFWILSDKVT